MSVRIEHDSEGPYFCFDEQQKILVRPDFRIRAQIGGRQDLLARASGYKKNLKLKVLDLTAGLCRDSFHFSCLGCEVTALERNASLLEVVGYYIKQLPKDLSLQLVQGDARDWLKNITEGDRPDVIYYDPMFPEKKKSAKSGKETELLKRLSPISPPEEEVVILNAAMICARKRVVVKRAPHAPYVGAIKPDIEFQGKAVRYDVYIIKP